MPNRVFIETERTFLRLMQVTDLRGIFEMHNDPDTQRFTWIEGLLTPEEILSWILQNQMLSNPELPLFAIMDKHSAAFLGLCGLRLRPDLNHAIDLTYRIHPGVRLQGLATEAASAVLDWGRREKNIREVLAQVHEENYISMRIMEKLQFSLLETQAPWQMYRFEIR